MRQACRDADNGGAGQFRNLARPDVFQNDPITLERLDVASDDLLDPQRMHARLNVAVVQCVGAPGGNAVIGRDVVDGALLGTQLVGDGAGVVEVVVVKHHDRAIGDEAVHDVVGREDAALLKACDAHAVAAPIAVAAPMAAGCQQHVFGTEVQHILRGHRAALVDVHIGHDPDLSHAPVAHPCPLGQTGQARLAANTAAEFAAGFAQVHFVAALAQRARGFQAGRTGADDQHLGGRLARCNALRMPALAPLLAHGRVLRAADRCHRVVARDADVAAYAFTDVIDAAFLDFLRQKGVGNRRPRRADHVQDAAPDLRHHGVG